MKSAGATECGNRLSAGRPSPRASESYALVDVPTSAAPLFSTVAIIFARSVFGSCCRTIAAASTRVRAALICQLLSKIFVAHVKVV
jgi:hypothetical protein